MQLTNCEYSFSCLRFQSMHPIKDATYMSFKTIETQEISIHAPYKGCNTSNLFDFDAFFEFQSMHPIKDATFRRHNY